MGRLGTAAYLATIVVFVALLLLMITALACHECLTLPMAAECERSNDAVYTEFESNPRTHRDKGVRGCIFYWHEANTGAD
jgi:hypothetical protein